MANYVVVLQVDMRYRNINDSTYSIAVQLNGYYIATVITIVFRFSLGKVGRSIAAKTSAKILPTPVME